MSRRRGTIGLSAREAVVLRTRRFRRAHHVGIAAGGIGLPVGDGKVPIDRLTEIAPARPCKAQLAAFARARASLRSMGVEIVAISVDDEPVSAALVAEDAAYPQSTGFVLDKHGRILNAVYVGPTATAVEVGRLVRATTTSMVLPAVPGLGLLFPTIALHESINPSLELGILLIGGGIWIVTNPIVASPRRPA